MLSERDRFSWRTRSLAIGAVYFLYFVALIVALAVGSNDDDAVRPSLIVMITVATLHFALGLYSAVFERGRVELTPVLQTLVELGDWMAAGALGVACDAVSRVCGDQRDSMLVAGVLLIAAQCVCAYKTATFLNTAYYDAETGALLQAR